ncbi:retrovirus-related Pol polyprotein from type-1 retrotransposable element R2 [Elysia marginata]|uniref:Retrovirus-related Pol polyprotein from type-1 retrotransposable element R2 n=1 Tax=Elysia marginata TaxID=1093978 RepID=A0AAV4F7Z0_9GAST|nr:retrovirus-related Pol polyprotein from type-1 retrotransposable element R2 [Elysia marginata]
MSEAVKIKRGVRQGCVMSPAIFNLFIEYNFRTIDNIPGLTAGGININNLRYADDTVMLAENEDDLQKLVNIVKEESEKCGLFINIRKTKTMVISREKVIPQIDIKIDGELVEQVANFTYLGHWITEDGRMARISWKEKKKNKEVLEEIGLKHTGLLKTVKTRQLAYYGHIRRHQSLQKSIMEGKINGKRQRFRKRESWLGNIEETTTRRINECCEVALDREEWRRTIASNL